MYMACFLGKLLTSAFSSARCRSRSKNIFIKQNFHFIIFKKFEINTNFLHHIWGKTYMGTIGPTFQSLPKYLWKLYTCIWPLNATFGIQKAISNTTIAYSILTHCKCTKDAYRGVVLAQLWWLHQGWMMHLFWQPIAWGHQPCLHKIWSSTWLSVRKIHFHIFFIF